MNATILDVDNGNVIEMLEEAKNYAEKKDIFERLRNEHGDAQYLTVLALYYDIAVYPVDGSDKFFISTLAGEFDIENPATQVPLYDSEEKAFAGACEIFRLEEFFALECLTQRAVAREWPDATLAMQDVEGEWTVGLPEFPGFYWFLFADCHYEPQVLFGEVSGAEKTVRIEGFENVKHYDTDEVKFRVIQGVNREKLNNS